MLKTIGKGAAAIVLMIALVLSGVYAGRKSVPRVLIFDSATGQAVDVAKDKDVTIYVIGPNGIEPGFSYGHTKDGSKVLVVPPEVFSDPSEQPQAPQAPEQQQSSPLQPHLPPVART